MSRRYIAEVTRAAVLEELRNGVPARELARKYGISESSVSRWKSAANIDTTHGSATVRSKPLPKSVSPVGNEVSEEPSGRRGMLKRMIGLVNDLAEDGGLKSHDIKNLALASKALAEADAKLEKEEQARGSLGSFGKGNSGVPDLDALVGCYPDGTPKNLEIYFGVLDAAEARDKGDTELEAESKQRVRQACVRAGVPAGEIDFKAMMDRIQADFVRENGPYRGEGEYA